MRHRWRIFFFKTLYLCSLGIFCHPDATTKVDHQWKWSRMKCLRVCVNMLKIDQLTENIKISTLSWNFGTFSRRKIEKSLNFLFYQYTKFLVWFSVTEKKVSINKITSSKNHKYVLKHLRGKLNDTHWHVSNVTYVDESEQNVFFKEIVQTTQILLKCSRNIAVSTYIAGNSFLDMKFMGYCKCLQLSDAYLFKQWALYCWSRKMPWNQNFLLSTEN